VNGSELMTEPSGWRRVAFTRVQIDNHDLPGFDVDTKRGDSRDRWGRTHDGHRGWELDALSPVDLRADGERAIRAVINGDAWNHSGVREAADGDSLATILHNWRSAISGKAPT
jgi:hypothetical protein